MHCSDCETVYIDRLFALKIMRVGPPRGLGGRRLSTSSASCRPFIEPGMMMSVKSRSNSAGLSAMARACAAFHGDTTRGSTRSPAPCPKASLINLKMIGIEHHAAQLFLFRFARAMCAKRNIPRGRRRRYACLDLNHWRSSSSETPTIGICRKVLASRATRLVSNISWRWSTARRASSTPALRSAWNSCLSKLISAVSCVGVSRLSVLLLIE